jgi:hypothetical protein
MRYRITDLSWAIGAPSSRVRGAAEKGRLAAASGRGSLSRLFVRSTELADGAAPGEKGRAKPGASNRAEVWFSRYGLREDWVILSGIFIVKVY